MRRDGGGPSGAGRIELQTPALRLRAGQQAGLIFTPGRERYLAQMSRIARNLKAPGYVQAAGPNWARSPSGYFAR